MAVLVRVQGAQILGKASQHTEIPAAVPFADIDLQEIRAPMQIVGTKAGNRIHPARLAVVGHVIIQVVHRIVNGKNLIVIHILAERNRAESPRHHHIEERKAGIGIHPSLRFLGGQHERSLIQRAWHGGKRRRILQIHKTHRGTVGRSKEGISVPLRPEKSPGQETQSQQGCNSFHFGWFHLFFNHWPEPIRHPGRSTSMLPPGLLRSGINPTTIKTYPLSFRTDSLDSSSACRRLAQAYPPDTAPGKGSHPARAKKVD